MIDSVGLSADNDPSNYSKYCDDPHCAECNFRKLQHKLFAINRDFNRGIQIFHLDKAFYALYHNELAN